MSIVLYDLNGIVVRGALPEYVDDGPDIVQINAFLFHFI